MTSRILRYRHEGTEVALGLDEAGHGRPVVLLPALSSISTRAEMRPLFRTLASLAHVTTVDWPGFGDLPRPRIDWSPTILSAFLDWFLREIVPGPHIVVAAGHAATYALHHAAHHPGTIERLVLIAPTWRGPFPTMMGGVRPWFGRVRAAVDNAMAGPLLYHLNVSAPVVRRMAREHVYSDPRWLTGDCLQEKLAVTRAAGARHASVRFVTGALDRVESRACFLDLARRANVPILVVYGDQTPPKSRGEMEALAALPDVEAARLAQGKLAVHEEYAQDVGTTIATFLDGGMPKA
ncbi:alpha/beta fold hydrolase [Paraburkholderia sp. MM5477-R1]|uniref:alpha/beta fold hydrolase n=1 Tax=Paraburkholderia sp. MM5477-R1 TaxID=2991062 RepID=UPI003D193992